MDEVRVEARPTIQGQESHIKISISEAYVRLSIPETVNLIQQLQKAISISTNPPALDAYFTPLPKPMSADTAKELFELISWEDI